jgi:plastocyanin
MSRSPVGWKALMGLVAAVALVGAACAKSTTAASGSQSPSASSSSNSYNEGGGRYGGGVATSPPGANTIQQGAGGLVFAPSTLTVKEGTIITVINVGTVNHTFTVQGKNIDVVNSRGASQQVTIDLKPGTYTFICRFHFSQGMKGTLVVTS